MLFLSYQGYHYLLAKGEKRPQQKASNLRRNWKFARVAGLNFYIL